MCLDTDWDYFLWRKHPNSSLYIFSGNKNLNNAGKVLLPHQLFLYLLS